MCKGRFIGGRLSGRFTGPTELGLGSCCGKKEEKERVCIGRARENIERDRKEMGPKCLHCRGKSLGGWGGGSPAPGLENSGRRVWCGVPGMPCNR